MIDSAHNESKPDRLIFKEKSAAPLTDSPSGILKTDSDLSEWRAEYLRDTYGPISQSP